MDTFTLDNIDRETYEAGLKVQREKDQRWGNREWMAFRLSRQEKPKEELQPVRDTSEEKTAVARRIMGASEGDTTASRMAEAVEEENQKRLQEQLDFEKWDKQTSEVFDEIKPYLR